MQSTQFSIRKHVLHKVSLDKYAITQQEKKRLKEIAKEISQIRLIDIPPAARKMEHFSRSDTALIQRLDDIFWSEIPKMSIGKMLGDVVTVGGEQKAEAIRDVVKRLGAELVDVMYVGDSITDVEAFKLVRGNGGLTVSFNGNSYAVKNAEVAVLSENNLATAILLICSAGLGKKKQSVRFRLGILKGSKKAALTKVYLRQLSSLYPDQLPKAQIVTAKNMESLVKESSEFRKKVRGVAIGRLG